MRKTPSMKLRGREGGGNGDYWEMMTTDIYKGEGTIYAVTNETAIC
jgi:hypothetical protein